MGWEERLRCIMEWSAVIGAAILSIGFFGAIFIRARQGLLRPIITRHYPTVIGLPSAAAGALFLVCALRTVAGPIQLDVAGFGLMGASGPILMWVIVFLAIAVAIRITWPLEFKGNDEMRAGSNTPKNMPDSEKQI